MVLENIEEFMKAYKPADKMFNLVKERMDHLKENSFTVCCYGPSGAGKSSTLNYILSSKREYPLPTDSTISAGHVTLFSYVITYDPKYFVEVEPFKESEFMQKDVVKKNNKLLYKNIRSFKMEFKGENLNVCKEMKSYITKIQTTNVEEEIIGFKYIRIKGPWKNLENCQNARFLDIKGIETIESKDESFIEVIKEFKPEVFLLCGQKRQKEIDLKYLIQKYTKFFDSHIIFPILWTCIRDEDRVTSPSAILDEFRKDLSSICQNSPEIYPNDFEMRKVLFENLVYYANSIRYNDLETPEFAKNFITELENRVICQDLKYIHVRTSTISKILGGKTLFTAKPHHEKAISKYKSYSEDALKLDINYDLHQPLEDLFKANSSEKEKMAKDLLKSYCLELKKYQEKVFCHVIDSLLGFCFKNVERKNIDLIESEEVLKEKKILYSNLNIQFKENIRSLIYEPKFESKHISETIESILSIKFSDIHRWKDTAFNTLKESKYCQEKFNEVINAVKFNLKEFHKTIILVSKKEHYEKTGYQEFIKKFNDFFEEAKKITGFEPQTKEISLNVTHKYGGMEEVLYKKNDFERLFKEVQAFTKSV